MATIEFRPIGKMQATIIARALAEPEGVDMPSALSERRAVWRLNSRGIIRVSSDQRSYRISDHVKVEEVEDLLKALRAGPVSSDDWERYAASSNSLRVRICKLRADGHNIISQPLPRDRQGIQRVLYILED